MAALQMEFRQIRTQVLKFALVGLASTITTLAVLVCMVEFFGNEPVLSSVAGYCLGAALNYFLNYHVTFISTIRHAVAIPRFVLVIAGGLLINTAVMYLAVNLFRIPYVLAQVLAVGFVMFFSFICYRTWAFRG